MPVKLTSKPNTKTPRAGNGQRGNTNNLRHGVFSRVQLKRLDRRTREGKTLIAARGALTSAMGGQPSPQQSMLIDRISFKMLRCALYEMATLAGDTTAGTDHIYLAWANSLRLDLQALGMNRKNKPVINLHSYLDAAATPSPDP